jgi:hypothetical protein
MKRRSLWMLAGALSLAGVVFAVAVVRSRNGEAASQEKRPRSIVKAFANRPKVVTPNNVFDFGVMNPGDRRKHKFVVRNEGEADLKLALGKTTCKCTLANLDKAVIPAGESTEIELDWHTEDPQFRFRQAAVIDTNDPRQPVFELAVEGSVRTKLGSLPAEVYLPQIPKGASRTTEVTLYSQAFDRLDIKSIESTISSVTASLTDEVPSVGGPEESRYLRRLKIEKAPDSKPGAFSGVVRVHYLGSFHGGVPEPGVFELPVGGDTVGDLSLHGRNVTGTLLNLGTVARSQGTKQRAYVHVRGDASKVAFAFERATPSFLEVRIGPAEKLSPTMTRFPVEVAVPAGSPEVNLLTADSGQGEIVLKTTHPDHPQVRFQVALATSPN